jgi:GTP-binding protein
VINKIDLLDQETLALMRQDLLEKLSWQGPVFEVSAATGEGTDVLAQAVMRELELRREAGEPAP